MTILRDYQAEDVAKIFAEWESVRSTLYVAATGLGKTVVMTAVAQRMLPGRTMFLAHRTELITQARAAFLRAGMECEIEKAELTAETSLFTRTPVVLASVQTLLSGSGNDKRMKRFNPMDFSLLLYDESHHSVAEGNKSIVDYFTSGNPNLKVLGVTATPDRADEEALGQMFETVASERDILWAVDNGWLVPVQQQFVSAGDLDFSHIDTTAGDLNMGQLAAVMEAEAPVQSVVQATLEAISRLPVNELGNVPVGEWPEIIGRVREGDRRRGIVFTVSVKQAEMLCNIFNRVVPGIAGWVCGKTPDRDRAEVLGKFKDSPMRLLVNVGVACLDSETEILTRRGWASCDTIGMTDKVACWNDGEIHFAHPLAIEVRERKQSERMVTLQTKNRSIRVTDDHRMVIEKSSGFHVVLAKNLVGRNCRLPICGDSVPENAEVEQETFANMAARLRQNSYVLRKQGFTKGDAEREARRRLNERTSMRRLSPKELSLDLCRWIGFWCGDGTKSPLQTGGIEYAVAGSDQWPAIADWFEQLSLRCGFSFKKRRVKPTKDGRNFITRWSFCRGTGFGNQKVHGGLYSIEPYLEKNGSDLLWSFSKEQFDAFIHGLWCADGDHGQKTDAPRSARIYCANFRFLDLVQSVAVCRGYRANIQRKNNHGFTLGCLSLVKRKSHIATKHKLQFEPEFHDERVWCVKSETGFIVTRRRGTVTITGNTEGYDNPNVDLIVGARPTKSRSLYAQMIGRSTRALPGIVDGPHNAEARQAAIAASAKPFCTILDFVGNSGKHKLITTADVLGGNISDEAIERAVKKAKKDGQQVDMRELLEKSEEEIRREREERLARDQAQKAKLVAKVRYVSRAVNPFDAYDLQPARARGWDAGKRLSEKQANVLRKIGVDPDQLDYAQGKALLNETFRRWNMKLATMKQCALLKKHGYETKEMTMKEASAKIDALAKNGWQRPATPVMA